MSTVKRSTESLATATTAHPTHIGHGDAGGSVWALPAELVCAILERVELQWLAVAARVSTTWYDCAVAVGGDRAPIVTEALVDEALLGGANDVVRWCVQDLGCTWSARRALVAALVDSPLVQQFGGRNQQSPATALVALLVDDPTATTTATTMTETMATLLPPQDKTLSERINTLEGAAYHWDDATLACAAVGATPLEFEALADVRPDGIGLAWVIASALGRVDLLDLLQRRWSHTAPRQSCVHVSDDVVRAWIVSTWGRSYAHGDAGVSVCGWRSWADPPEHALAVWIAQQRAEFVADPRGRLAAALLGVEYDAVLACTGDPTERGQAFARMALFGRPLYERGPYLSESAKIARHTMLQVEAILKGTRARRNSVAMTASQRPRPHECEAR